ncbi:MAG: cold shock domain-containing protein [Rivularia sp. (in: cyanobacteria)]
MKPFLNKGQLITWKDDRGFGFIKPDNGGKEVFLHISALKGVSRRPKVGDTILYERVTESKGKVSTAKASIQGVVPRRKPIKRDLLKTIIPIFRIAITAAIVIPTIMEFNRNQAPSPITLIAKPGCTIKGNISINSGNKIYHIAGMEDYESTVISPEKGERWFCTESLIDRQWLA